MNCLSCKWYYNGVCNNKDLGLEVVLENDGDSYIDDGYLNEALQENLDIKDILEKILMQLQENSIIKKQFFNNYDKVSSKIDIDMLHEEINDLIEHSLFESLGNFFGETTSDKFHINEPDEFCCNKWE